MTDWNNKNLGTEATKSKKIVPIKNYICQKIDNDQKIKRLCRYLTLTPLSKKGILYDNSDTLLTQPDLVDSLIKESTEGNSNGKILIPYSFNEGIITEQQVFIFVHNYSNDYNSRIGDNTFIIDILVPVNYDQIDPYSEQRLYLIVNRIIELFDDTRTDNEYVETLGLLDFKVGGRSNEYRLSKTQNIVGYPIFITTKLCNMRG